MKEVLLSVLRDRNTSTAHFRQASDCLAFLLCAETLAKLTDGDSPVQTPLGTAPGRAAPRDIMLVPIMRAALSLLPAFGQLLPGCPVAMIGIERDEATAAPVSYYHRFPKSLPGRAIIIDPMLATGGTACLATQLLMEQGYPPQSIYFTGVIAAQEGLARLAQVIPEGNITVAAIDPDLNAQKFIVPGLGDYGDRYYGT
jgi:uracil phosphoribosyltransferase